MKYSKQRELILNTLRENPIHPTADEIYNMVREKEPKISLGTVYRNLNQLAENGIILKLPVQSGSDRYDGRIDTHVHIVCKHCGKVMDLNPELAASLCQNIEETTGFAINSERIVLEGVCKDCQAKGKKETA